MIIDVHNHIVAGGELNAYQAGLIHSRGFHGKGHGGGSIPYQVGRWRSQLRGPNDTETFDQRLRQLYFDTALYNVESLELLFKVVGPDRCLFGTERPGAGSKTDPRPGRWYDDVRPLIEEIPWLTAEHKERVFHKNAGQVFSRFKSSA